MKYYTTTTRQRGWQVDSVVRRAATPATPRQLIGGVAGVSARLPGRTGSNPMESEWVFSPVATEAVNGN